MGEPITWRTVQGPNLADSLRPMESAQRSFNGAFDGLAGVFKQQQTTDQANWDQAGANNAEAFKSALYGITTPEQMAAAQKSGQFNEMLKGYGAQVKNPGELRALMDGRLASLQGQATANTAYDNSVIDNREAGDRDKALAFYAQGNPFAGDLAAANVTRNRASLAEANHAGLRRGVVEGQVDAEATRKANSFQGELDARAAQTAASNAQTAQSKAQTEDIPKERDTREAAALQARYKINQDLRADIEAKLVSGQAGTIGAVGATDTMVKNIQAGIKDQRTKEAVSTQSSKALQSDPRFNDLPSEIVDRIIRKHAGTMEGTLWGTNDRSDAIVADLNKALVSQGDKLSAVLDARKATKARQSDLKEQGTALEAQMFPEMVTKRLARDQQTITDAAEKAKADAAAKAGGTPPAGTPVPTPIAAPADALFNEQVQVEQLEMQKGMRKSFTKEVASYINSESSRDRESIGKVGTAAGTAALSVGNAFNDIFTLPVRAAGGALNTALRLPNAFGANIPYIPDKGGMLSSMTPYSDAMTAANNQGITEADLTARRANLDAKLKEALAKKAK